MHTDMGAYKFVERVKVGLCFWLKDLQHADWSFAGDFWNPYWHHTQRV